MALLLGVSGASGQDVAKPNDIQLHLKETLLHPPLTFRTPYSAPQIEFDADGRCVSHCNPGGWAGDGALIIKNVRVDGDSIHLSGQRLVIYYDIAGTRAEFPAMQFELTIALRQPLTEKSADQALSTIFRSPTDPDPEFAPPDNPPLGYECIKKDDRQYCREKGSVSDWQLVSNIGDTLQVGTDAQGEKIYLTSKPVLPPRATFTPDPEYSESDRKHKRSGSVSLGIVVSQSGRVDAIRIDKQSFPDSGVLAAKAIAQWKFTPAMLNGRPVATLTSVEVDFRLY